MLFRSLFQLVDTMTFRAFCEQVDYLCTYFFNPFDRQTAVKEAKHLEAETLREALIRMVDAQTILNLEEADQDELPGMGNVTPSGKTVAFGNTPKRRQKRTPDSLANDQRFKFDDIEHDAPTPELEDWEGERVNRDLNKELSLGFTEDD